MNSLRVGGRGRSRRCPLKIRTHPPSFEGAVPDPEDDDDEDGDAEVALLLIAAAVMAVVSTCSESLEVYW